MGRTGIERGSATHVAVAASGVVKGVVAARL